MTWQALPEGQDVPLTVGNAYAVTASVSTSHTQAAIQAEVKKLGLTLYSYAEGPVSSGYRVVSGAATASQSGSIPWSPGFPASLVAHYQLQNAWVWASAGSSQPTPPVDVSGAAPSVPAPAPLAVYIFGGAALAYVGYYVWNWWSHR